MLKTANGRKGHHRTLRQQDKETHALHMYDYINEIIKDNCIPGHVKHQRYVEKIGHDIHRCVSQTD